MNDDDFEDVKEAARIELIMCAHCDLPHIVLFDENDVPIAQARISSRWGKDFVKELQDLLYAVAADE